MHYDTSDYNLSLCFCALEVDFVHAWKTKDFQALESFVFHACAKFNPQYVLLSSSLIHYDVSDYEQSMGFGALEVDFVHAWKTKDFKASASFFFHACARFNLKHVLTFEHFLNTLWNIGLQSIFWFWCLRSWILCVHKKRRIFKHQNLLFFMQVQNLTSSMYFWGPLRHNTEYRIANFRIHSLIIQE